MRACVSLFLGLMLGSAAFAAGIPKNTVHGSYIEARTADVYTGACFAMSEINLTGELAVMGWNIEKGAFDGVALDGLSVMGVVKATATLGDPMASLKGSKAVLIVDEKASPEQQVALRRFAQRMAGELMSDIVRMEVSPIRFDVKNNNIHTRVASMNAGKLARIETRALTTDDQICRHEDAFYPPLAAVDHAMTAYTEQNKYSGSGLDTTWNWTGKRASYIGTFHVTE